MTSVSVSVEPYSVALHEEIVSKLVAFNDTQAGSDNFKPITVTAREGGELVAGASGAMYFDWLFISHLWVHEKHRGARLGSELLQRAETEAIANGCGAVWLDTFSFQAKPFYEKHGYRQFGELPEYPPGFARFFLWKPLTAI